MGKETKETAYGNNMRKEGRVGMDSLTLNSFLFIFPLFIKGFPQYIDFSLDTLLYMVYLCPL